MDAASGTQDPTDAAKAEIDDLRGDLKELIAHARTLLTVSGVVFAFAVALGVSTFGTFFRAMLRIYTTGEQASATARQDAITACLQQSSSPLNRDLCSYIDPSQFPLPDTAKWALAALGAMGIGVAALAVALLLSLVALRDPIPPRGLTVERLTALVARKRGLCNEVVEFAIAGFVAVAIAEVIANVPGLVKPA